LHKAAASAGVSLAIISAYRSYTEQEATFANWVKTGGYEQALRTSARAGHSEHQLGTTIDFTDVFRGFGASPPGLWLQAHGHEFGFVLPYTEAAQERTGYVPEPWHGRWVGRPLAQALYAAGYPGWDALTVDDAIARLRAEAGLG
jgi:D-alanyl-D-alanine carboxypeptidase